MNISDIIKQAREEMKLTQEDLAERLEVSRQAVSKWELGASVPSPENLKLLEEVLGAAFPAPEAEVISEETVPGAPPKTPFWNCRAPGFGRADPVGPALHYDVQRPQGGDKRGCPGPLRAPDHRNCLLR